MTEDGDLVGAFPPPQALIRWTDPVMKSVSERINARLYDLHLQARQSQDATVLVTVDQIGELISALEEGLLAAYSYGVKQERAIAERCFDLLFGEGSRLN